MEKIVSAIVATRNAAGTAYPPPETATGTLNIIAASGAAPVTMQNRTAGRPSASRASSFDAGAAVGAAGVATDMGRSTSRYPIFDSGPPSRDPPPGLALAVNQQASTGLVVAGREHVGRPSRPRVILTPAVN